MKRHQLYLILPPIILLLILIASRISVNLYQHSKLLRSEPDFSIFDEIDKEMQNNARDLIRLRENTEKLKSDVETLTATATAAANEKQKKYATAKKRREETIIDAQQVMFAEPQDTQTHIILTQARSPIDTPTVEFFANDLLSLTPTPVEYWQKIQDIAAIQIFGRENKTKFLQSGSEIIQNLEEAEASYRVALMSADWIDTHTYDDDISAVLKLHQALEDVATQKSLVLQCRRDIEALIAPHADKKLLKLSRSGDFSVSSEKSLFSHLSADRNVTITPDGQFIITIHFFYHGTKAGIPTLVNMTDTYNLNQMQSVGQDFFYPQHFTNSIYQLMRQMWRAGRIEWGKEVNEQRLQQFLSIIQRG